MRTDEKTDKQKDGRKDMAKPNVAFRNFPNAPKKRRLIYNHITRKFILCLIYVSRRDTFRHEAPYTFVWFLNNFPEVITHTEQYNNNTNITATIKILITLMAGPETWLCNNLSNFGTQVFNLLAMMYHLLYVVHPSSFVKNSENKNGRF